VVRGGRRMPGIYVCERRIVGMHGGRTTLDNTSIFFHLYFLFSFTSISYFLSPLFLIFFHLYFFLSPLFLIFFHLYFLFSFTSIFSPLFFSFASISYFLTPDVT
jgi:hypothetical protein